MGCDHVITIAHCTDHFTVLSLPPFMEEAAPGGGAGHGGDAAAAWADLPDEVVSRILEAALGDLPQPAPSREFVPSSVRSESSYSAVRSRDGVPGGRRAATRAELEVDDLYLRVDLPFNYICSLDRLNAIWGPRNGCSHNRLGSEEGGRFGHQLVCETTLACDDPTWMEDPHVARRAEWLGLVRTLCRLERCCRHLWEPCIATASGAGDGEGAPVETLSLSLPEAAARQYLLALSSAPTAAMRTDATKLRPGETWKQQLHLAGIGALCTGPLHNLPVSAVESMGGWQLAYDEPYYHKTSDRLLTELVPEDAAEVFVGARNADSAVFHLSARAPTQVVRFEGQLKGLNVYRDGPNTATCCHEQTYWYWWREHSFGFSADKNLFLYYADSAIAAQGRPEPASESRLSWNLESQSTGGWRAGTVTELGEKRRGNRWRKCLYYRMANVAEDRAVLRRRELEHRASVQDEPLEVGTRVRVTRRVGYSISGRFQEQQVRPSSLTLSPLSACRSAVHFCGVEVEIFASMRLHCVVGG